MDTLEKLFEKIPNWIRWILICPISVLTYFLVNMFSNIAGTVLNFFSRDPWSDKFFTHLVSPGFAGFASIAIAIALAPKGQRQVGLLITGVWLLVYGAVTMLAFANGDWKSAIPGIVSAATSIFAYVELKPKPTPSYLNDS
jgi:hypothetical protein